jgi:disulfide bond formation protein DsbB
MSVGPLQQLRQEPFALAAAAIALVGLAAIAGALFFQYGMGLSPCPLCLEQRIAYYVAIPLAAMVMLGVSVGASRKVLILALLAIAAAMLWNAGLGAYHAGVEWKWWEGPRDCSGPVNSLGSARDMLSQLQNTRIVRCDEAAWRFLGLSLAGYNVLISLALAALAAWGVVRGRSYGSSSVSQYR